ncbi:inositol monophosphatase 2-like isoform X1 [Bradysia coprophila]|uniref:inositol monophosphatase 2-like isoform X1 n=1 Tax=Bradysia coprophila TaxID=38358 RepID=UPI00187D7A62|nr:inositol monophosphatase 2-like isoform X1 [Bradysia coprophila]
MMETTFNEIENELIDDCYNFINVLAIDAGTLVKKGFTKAKNVSYKTSNADLVTEYDRRCEQLLIQGIQNRYPDHKFLAEESTSKLELTDDPTWVIDPIDGTTNYVHGIPLIAISIALVLKKQIVIGVIYNPLHEEYFKCRLGRGAYLNDERIYCSKTETLEQSVYAHEVSMASVEWLREKNMKRVYKFASIARGLRTLGSAALTLAYVARGCIDGYQVDDLKPWDVAAGALLIREAGGVVYKTDGTTFDFMNSYLVCAGTEKLCQQLIDGIKETDSWSINFG